jgi:uncharacterized protein YutD
MLYFLLVKGTKSQYRTLLKKQPKILTDHRHFENQDSISHFVPNSIQFSVNICEKISTALDLFMSLCNTSCGFYVLLHKTKWDINRITQRYTLHKI